MHSHLLDSSDVDSNLYPALLQVFTIILIGYVAGALKIVSKEQGMGLNIFVGTFVLPSLLLKNIATLDFSKVDWYFLGSIFVSKSIVFFLAIFLTLITMRPLNLGLAGAFAIFVSQSNDFALGVPIVNAIYTKTHPNFIDYIYLIAPISLCILNPIAFFLLELNEHWKNNKEVEEKNLKESSKLTDNTSPVKDSSGYSNEPSTSYHSLKPYKRISSYIFEREITKTQELKTSKKLSTKGLLKHTLWSTFKNPIVFMTFVGLIVNVIFKQKIPALVEPIITTLSNAFSAIALFYLGMTMVGKIKNLTFSMIIIIIILIFGKGLLFPLITREMVFFFESFQGGVNETVRNLNNDDYSTFGFLYGTFPSAPSLLVFIGRYKSIQHDLISSAIVFGTLTSAPLMMVSGKMISIEYFNHSSSNFEDIQCKTAYGFSFATWFCCIWVLYIFLASGRIWHKPHKITFFLLISQMINSLIHIIWASATNDSTNVNILQSYTYVFFTLLAAFMTRCLPLSIILNIISLTKIHRFNQASVNKIIFKLAESTYTYLFLGFILPFLAALICIMIGGLPEKQGMMISIGQSQIIVSIVLLVFLIFFTSYCLILFARTKFDETSVLSILADNKTRYYSTSSPSKSEVNSDINSDNDDSGTNLLRSKRGKSIPEYSKNNLMAKLNNQYQIMQHISLVVILLFASVMCLFVQIWSIRMEVMTGIFYELQLLDTTLLYGQGFFVFLTFGFDSEFIFTPLIFKIKELLGIVKPYKLIPESEISEETTEMCEKFENQYKDLCAGSIVKNQRYHYVYYQNVFAGSDLVDWLIDKKLVKTRKQAKILGRKLMEGRVIHHVSFKRDFYDGFHLYKFY